MAKRKSKKQSQHKLHIWHFVLLFILLSSLLTGLFLKYGNSALAAPSFYLKRVTVGEAKRGGTLEYNVMVLGQTEGSALNTGIAFDKRKLKLDAVDSGELGDVSWQAIADDGDKSRIVITNAKVNSGEDSKQFARLHFTIIDATDEKNEAGQGFTEICSIFDPEGSYPTSIPEADSSPQPTAQANTPAPTRTSEPSPTPIPQSNVDLSKLCIPLEIHGSSADKLDYIIIPSNYDPARFDLAIQDAQAAIEQLGGTNLSGFRNEVLNKINWYILNINHERMPAQYRNTRITSNVLEPAKGKSEIEIYRDAVIDLCTKDRYAVQINASELIVQGYDPVTNTTGNYTILGSSNLETGFHFAARTLDFPNSNVFAHEWGHATAALLDEYNAGKWVSPGDNHAGYNCTLDPNTPNKDPCPNGFCEGEENNSIYKAPCPAWDCSKTQCDDLQKELFADAGCYQRCSSSSGYRSQPLSIMDAYVPGAGSDLTKYNGPSLYSIIKFAFGNYH